MLHFFEYDCATYDRRQIKKPRVGIVADTYKQALHILLDSLKESEDPARSFNYLGWEEEGINSNVLDHELYYKLVRREGNRLRSLYDLQDDPYWDLEYNLGKWTTPNFGRIFLFKGKINAIAHAAGEAAIADNIEAYLCEADDPVLINHAPCPTSKSDSYETFWRLYTMCNGDWSSYRKHPRIGYKIGYIACQDFTHSIFKNENYVARRVRLVKRVA